MSPDPDVRELVRRILEIVEGPDEDRDAAFRELRDLHPTRARWIDQCVIAAEAGLDDEGILAELEHALASTVPESAEAGESKCIGPYRILRVLGHGGMGIVYLAAQKTPVRRRVALKVIKRGMDTDQVIARFGLERQALAVMSHPAIAKVFDAGSTSTGQPYFVMEFVEGIPLTEYCDEQRLTIEERIGVFQQVCRGVQHAHQKGVLHRDLKPGNILVARKDEQHVVKIIDFGLARATDQQLVEQTIFTEQGQVIGTPEYMSPEQAGGSALAIDTRTDIYSLGVVLYELIAGELPFSSQDLRAAGMLELQRIIREVEPVRPSTRLSSLGDAGALAASRRRLSPVALRKHLRGDLDWIVMRAMAKEAHRRYESATSLARDLERYLAHEPVEAGPPSAGYRVRKFVRKYRTQVAAGALIFSTAVVGIVIAWVYAQEALAQATRFDRLAVFVRLQEAMGAQESLRPAWPKMVERLRRWVQVPAREIAREHRRVRSFKESLSAEAVEQTDAEREAARRSHPKFGELLLAREDLARHQVDRERRKPETIASLRREVEELEQIVGSRQGWNFPTPSDRLLFTFLTEVEASLQDFEAKTIPDVKRRLWWAERVAEATLHHQEARVTWTAAAAAIRASPKYQFRASPSAEIEYLDVKPQWGLVPIGENPETGLWEFYHLRSAWKRKFDHEPKTFPIPEFESDGTIEVSRETGIIFVLLPKAKYWMGSQSDDPKAPNYDKNHRNNEHLHHATVDAFFAARHETTQGQWKRLHGTNPSFGGTSDLTRPVQQIGWLLARQVFLHNGLDLPSEVQWEYACRASTDKPWYHLDDPRSAELRKFANLKYSAKENPWFEAVGERAPNAFGMHDMLGNVFEWCIDRFQGKNRVYRGGAYFSPPTIARTSARFSATNLFKFTVGFRAVRPLR